MKDKVLYIIVILLIAAVTYQYVSDYTKKKDIYFEVVTLYSEFDFKKELEVNYDKIVKSKEAKLDSLKMIFEKKISLSKEADPSKDADLIGLKNQYFKLSEKIAQENQYLKQDYENKIWDRLNSYIEEFGKENNYRLVFGASGNGVIFYADNAMNKTDEIIEYVNQRYSGEDQQ